MERKELFEEIRKNVIDMEEEKVAALCKDTIRLNYPAHETIQEALIPGMNEVSRLFAEEEYFLPEVLLCADAMNAGLDEVMPYLDKSKMEQPVKMVIGVVEGDTHDIGKNLVRILSEAGGIEVHDLGKDVPLDRFIDKAEEINADFIGMSTLMTTTMDGMGVVIEKLKEKGTRDKYTVMIGGGPISQKFADEIGADVYTQDANEAVKRIKELISIKGMK